MVDYVSSDRGPALSRLHPRRIRSIRAVNTHAIWNLLRQVVFAILLTRSFSDPVFGLFTTDFGSSSIGFGAIINALVIAVAVVLLLQQPLRAPSAVFAIWTPFLVVAFASIYYTNTPQATDAPRVFLVLVTYWALFIIPFFIFRSRSDLPRFVLLIFASSIVPSLYAFYDIWRGLSYGSEFRLASTFPHPNIFAFYLVLLLGLALYARASQSAAWPAGTRRLVSYYIPLLLFFLALTKTRSAWVACAVMFLVYALLFDRRFLLGFLAAPLFVLVDPSLLERLVDVLHSEEIEDLSRLNEDTRLNSFAWRELLWTSAIPWIAVKPFFGYGLDSFRTYSLEFFPLVHAFGVDSHNFFLQVLFEMGLVGAVALVWLFAAIALRIIQGLPYDRNGMVVTLTLLVAYSLEAYSDNMMYYLSFNWYFWFALGTICAWIELEKVRLRPKPMAASEARLPMLANG